MTVKEYLPKINSTCDLLSAYAHLISANEQVDIVLVGLSAELDSVFTFASFSPKPLAMDRLVDILLECESRKFNYLIDGPPVSSFSSPVLLFDLSALSPLWRHERVSVVVLNPILFSTNGIFALSPLGLYSIACSLGFTL
ncbi:hypothetical protein J1N35_022893 [Gossypium stocksii]|uniref:Uncharacterized protein n=1 Tax=Gossypium stocksii TaxID=47602 RepID=A0A9D3VIJ7_9ROSI|nr:hypothetical protein J1N35_022893 [Gossypium stocksii]